MLRVFKSISGTTWYEKEDGKISHHKHSQHGDSAKTADFYVRRGNLTQTGYQIYIIHELDELEI